MSNSTEARRSLSVAAAPKKTAAPKGGGYRRDLWVRVRDAYWQTRSVMNMSPEPVDPSLYCTRRRKTSPALIGTASVSLQNVATEVTPHERAVGASPASEGPLRSEKV